MGTLRTLAVTAALLAAGQILGYAAEAYTPANAPLPTIKGIILDAKGKPVRGVQAFGTSYTSQAAMGYGQSGTVKVVVDRNGRFTFRPKVKSDLGFYIVTATANGYACGSGMRRVGAPDEKQEIRITLRPGYTLKGKVIDESDKPVSGAKVEVESCFGYKRDGTSSHIPGNIGGVLERTTGRDGRFAISRLLRPSDHENFSVSLKVSKKGRATVQKGFSRSGSTDQIAGGVTVKQPLECRAEGVLYLPDKTTPAPTGISVAALVDMKYGWQPRMCVTDKNGKVHFDALPPGKTTFLLPPPGSRGADGKMIAERGPDWVLPTVVKDLKPKEQARLQLFAETGALVTGKVTTKDGKPAPRATLLISDRCSPSGPYSSWRTTTTDDKGEFTARVASGKVRLTVQRLQYGGFMEQEVPSVELTTEDGQEKADVALVVEPSADSPGFDMAAASKPVPEDFELKPSTYELTWDPDFNCANAFQSYSQLAEDKIKSYLKATPTLASANPYYAACPLDGAEKDGCIAIVLDESKGTGKGYDTAYVDSNRNWDLTDDKPITFPAPKGYRQLHTDEFSVPLRQHDDDGKVSERTIQARLQIYGDADYIQAQLVTKGAWKGTVESNKGKIECAVMDTDCDGVCGTVRTFQDNGDIDSEGDYVFLDTNGAGSVVAYSYGSHGITLYRVCKVGGKLYNISTSSLGDKITIAPYTGPMGRLLVRGTNVQGIQADAGDIAVAGDQGFYEIKRTGEKEVSLPVGRYRVGSCSLRVKSLAMVCQLDSPVEVKPDGLSTVDVGGKLSLAIDPAMKDLVWRPGQTETLEWIIKLGGNATIISLGRSTNAPKVKFFNSKGKLIHTCKAGYT